MPLSVNNHRNWKKSAGTCGFLVDLGRAAGEAADLNRFLDQAVVQVARAVEINHVKVLRYRRREADLLVAAGFGWREGVVLLRDLARRFAVATRALRSKRRNRSSSGI